MKHLDLFSGIGGFALAARWVGWETVGFCEIDPYCQRVLRKHWPDVQIYDDVRELSGNAVGPVDIITGGYPCQPFSLAGKRRGAADHRHLWPEFARLIRELRPRWAVGENVAGHITMGLDQVLADLEGLSYAAEPFVIPACALDAPHRRDRVWIVAHAIGERGWTPEVGELRREDSAEPGDDGQARPLADSERTKVRRRSEEDGSRKPNAADRFGICGQDVQDTAHNTENGKGIRRREPSGFWRAEPGVGRVANGVPARVDRLRGLGNAIVPQVAEVIFRCIDELNG